MKRVSIILLMVIMMSIFAPLSAFAAQDEVKTLKVGFCKIEGFFDINKNGERSGYGVDVLNAIAEKSNLRFEYVDVWNWEELQDMLLSGEIDIKMPVAGSAKKPDGVSYGTESVIYTYETLMAKNSREDLHYEDFEAINKSRVAIIPSVLEQTKVKEYFRNMKLSPTFIYYDTFNQCKRAVDEGRADILLSNIMDNRKDLKILARFSASNNFIAMREGDENLKVIDQCLSELRLNDPGFFNKLESKYYPQRNQTPLSRVETDFVAKQKEIKVALYMEDKPMAYTDETTGDMRGINVDLVNLIKERTGLNLKIVPVYAGTDIKEYLESGRVDLIFPGDPYQLEGGYNSDDIMQSTVAFAAIGGAVAGQGSTMRVGVVSNNLSTVGMLKRASPEIRLVEYTNNAECLEALQQQEIDLIAKNSFSMSYLLQQPRYQDIRTLSYLSLQNSWSFTGKGEQIVCSILNKGISTITESERNQITEQYTLLMPYEKSFGDMVYKYRYACVVGGAGLLLLLILIFGYANAKSKFMRQLEAKNLELGAANEAKGRFLSNISHDMRTPMNVIMGLTTLAMDDEKATEKTKGYLTDVYSSSAYLLGLINDVLDMAKIENGQFSLNLAPIDYEEFRAAVLRTVEPLAEKKGITFNVIEEGQMIPIISDKLRINQVFFNLISNAVKFTPKGGTVEFIIRNKGVHEGIVTFEFIVRDNGIGMSESFQENMFNSFAREERDVNGQIEGTGLGLSIVHSIVEKLEGNISVKSQKGEGTEFTVVLNFLTPSAENITQRELAGMTEMLKGKNVLLVEDHPLNTLVSTKMLEKMEINVYPAENGQEAVDAFTNATEGFFDAILMDIRMPIMDGLTATRAIRQLDRGDAKNVPIIAMTANAYEEDVLISLKAGMNAHIAKPIDPQLLYKTLNQLTKKENDK